MEFAAAADIADQIADILNAAKTYGGAIVAMTRSSGAIAAARIAAGKAVLRAIFSYPQGEYYGGFVVMTAVAHDAFIDSSKTVGVPWIIPFDGGVAREGIPADADEIDAYRLYPELYSGAVDGVTIAHDAKDGLNRQSPVACRYNITGRRLKFTGFSATVPLMPEITDELASASIPQGVSPAVVKLAIPLLVKEGDNLAAIAREYGADGKQDLVEIAGGAIRVRPVRAVADIMAEQKQT